MISLKYNFLFVHIPKSAGNSIQNILRNYSEDKIVCLFPYQDGAERFNVQSSRFNTHKHSTLQDYREQVGKESFQRLFKFTSVRNPWERMISFYFSPHRGDISWNREDFIKFVNFVPSITDYISLTNTYSSDGSCFNNIDRFVRFEHLNDDFEQVCKRIGIGFTPLPCRNKSTRQKCMNYYDNELVELIRNKFLEEIEFFDYEYNGNT